MSNQADLDREAVEELAAVLFQDIRARLAPPYRRGNVFIVLNALACVAATVVAGAAPAAEEFFLEGFKRQLQLTKSEEPR